MYTFYTTKSITHFYVTTDAFLELCIPWTVLFKEQESIINPKYNKYIANEGGKCWRKLFKTSCSFIHQIAKLNGSLTWIILTSISVLSVKPQGKVEQYSQPNKWRY